MSYPFYPEYGFLFDYEVTQFPGIGDLLGLLGKGEELAKQRRALGLTQQQVADRANINIRQYQRLENGERSMEGTSLRLGLSVCYALNIDPMFYCAAYRNEQIQLQKEERQSEHDRKPTGRENYKYLLYYSKDDDMIGDLIAVEYGTDMDSAYEGIARAIRDELSTLDEYRGCGIDVYPYERMCSGRYAIQAVVLPPSAPSNEIVEFTVVEQLCKH